MRVFKNIWFNRFAKNEGITDAQLLEAANEVANGQVEADLGGGVFKKRIAREGEGKSGGYRLIVFFKDSVGRLFFGFAYQKSGRDNIDQNEKKYYKKLAKRFFSYTDENLNKLAALGDLIEIGDSYNG